ncbi:unnamed protein product [Sympodiomycopsis kandeliae]
MQQQSPDYPPAYPYEECSSTNARTLSVSQESLKSDQVSFHTAVADLEAGTWSPRASSALSKTIEGVKKVKTTIQSTACEVKATMHSEACEVKTKARNLKRKVKCMIEAYFVEIIVVTAVLATVLPVVLGAVYSPGPLGSAGNPLIVKVTSQLASATPASCEKCLGDLSAATFITEAHTQEPIAARLG